MIKDGYDSYGMSLGWSILMIDKIKKDLKRLGLEVSNITQIKAEDRDYWYISIKFQNIEDMHMYKLLGEEPFNKVWWVVMIYERS